MNAPGEAPSVVESAPAKVNLYLHVLGRRDDGYHLLDGLVVFADVADILEARPADELSLRVDGPFADAVPTDESNLVLRAARALASDGGLAAGAALHLHKRLPAAAGIGGGSADAAAALRALTRLWGIAPDPSHLARLALTLGADVPMCLEGRPAFVGGVGESLTAPPLLPETWLVLANPRVEVPTAAVFARRRGPFSQAARFDAPPPDVGALADVLGDRRNDLTAAACALAPEMAGVLEALAAEPGARLARMTGSGATGFALFASAAEAEAASANLAVAHPDWWIAAARIRD